MRAYCPSLGVTKTTQSFPVYKAYLGIWSVDDDNATINEIDNNIRGAISE
jgi:hypothetical protein